MHVLILTKVEQGKGLVLDADRNLSLSTKCVYFFSWFHYGMRMWRDIILCAC